MKAILEFTLPEEKEQFNVATHAEEFYFVLYHLNIWLRNLHKYHDVHTVSVDEIINKLNELMDEYNINLEMLS